MGCHSDVIRCVSFIDECPILFVSFSSSSVVVGVFFWFFVVVVVVVVFNV